MHSFWRWQREMLVWTRSAGSTSWHIKLFWALSNKRWCHQCRAEQTRTRCPMSRLLWPPEGKKFGWKINFLKPAEQYRVLVFAACKEGVAYAVQVHTDTGGLLLWSNKKNKTRASWRHRFSCDNTGYVGFIEWNGCSDVLVKHFGSGLEDNTRSLSAGLALHGCFMHEGSREDMRGAMTRITGQQRSSEQPSLTMSPMSRTEWWHLLQHSEGGQGKLVHIGDDERHRSGQNEGVTEF